MKAWLVEFDYKSRALDQAMVWFHVQRTQRAMFVPDIEPGTGLLVILSEVESRFCLMMETVGAEATHVPPDAFYSLPQHRSDLRKVGEVEVSDDLIQAAVQIVREHERMVATREAFRKLASTIEWRLPIY